MLSQQSINKHFKAEQGFSLIELMIAMTLGLLLLTGVIQIFLSSKQAYGTVSGASQTLDSGRLSMHFLSGSISKAGYWGDVNEARVYGSDTALAFNHSGASNAPYSDSYNGVFAEDVYIFGTDNDNADANVIDGTDQIWIRFNGHDTLPLTNCAGDSVNSNLIAVERYYISELNGNERVPSLVCETTLMSIDKITGTVSALANPVINTQILISGVDNLQVLFGQRSPDNNELQYFIASDVTDWSLIQGVRVAALASSADAVNSVSRTSGYDLLNETTNIPTDKRARRVFERTIALRNPNY